MYDVDDLCDGLHQACDVCIRALQTRHYDEYYLDDMILSFVIIIRALKTRHVYITKNLHTLPMSWIRSSAHLEG